MCVCVCVCVSHLALYMGKVRAAVQHQRVAYGALEREPLQSIAEHTQRSAVGRVGKGDAAVLYRCAV